MSSNYYKSGDYNAICDVCGFRYKASQLKKRWDGFMVCGPDWEMRHPSDFLRTPPPVKPPSWTRPEPTDTFITVDYIATTVGNQDATVPSGTYSPQEPTLP